MYWKLVFIWDVGTLISQELKMREEVHQRKRGSQCKNYKNFKHSSEKHKLICGTEVTASRLSNNPLIIWIKLTDILHYGEKHSAITKSWRCKS